MGVNYGDFAKSLDAARKEAPNGQEYWMGRDLQAVLNYARWENFEEVIRKAILACNSSGQPSGHHFRQTTKMVSLGSGSRRKIDDWFLSRYACYLVAMNGDPRVEEVAYAQQYFAVQTRLQEQEQQYDRLEHRRRVSNTVKALNSAAKSAGVQRYGLFHDAGYRGLYGGLGLSAIKQRKGISPKEELLDRAGRIELAAIELKNAITEEQITTRRIRGEQNAMDTHHRVGKEVRGAMEKSGTTMPEDLKPEESVKKISSARKNQISGPQQLAPKTNKVAGCAICDSGSPVRHFGSEFCKSGSLASGGTRAHCICDTCFWSRRQSGGLSRPDQPSTED